MNRTMMTFRRLAATALVLLVAACGRKADEPAPIAASAPMPQVAAAPEFTVLATSDLRDIQPLEQMVDKATGVKLKFRFGGTCRAGEAVPGRASDGRAATPDRRGGVGQAARRTGGRASG